MRSSVSSRRGLVALLSGQAQVAKGVSSSSAAWSSGKGGVGMRHLFDSYGSHIP